MKLAIIGTGYVGLVTGTCLAEVGHDVVCVDIDEAKIAKLRRAQIPIYEPGLADLVHKNHKAGRLRFTTSLKDLDDPLAIFFALPTPAGGDGQADLSYVLKATQDVAKVMKSYTVLVNKSTVPVGTAQQVRKVAATHTKVPFDVVSNPEFLREGFAVDDFMQPDRIVIGTSSAKAQQIMYDIYQPFVTTGVQLLVMDEASSEMTKYAANSFLATKISFINEIANLCELVGANVDHVREGIGTDERIGKRFLQPGIGYGGSCFPKDVMALEKVAHRLDYDFKILKAIMDVNDRQERVLVNKVVAHYGEDLSRKTFAVWGLAYKGDTDDIRESPSIEIIRELVGRGARVQAYDPQAADNTRLVLKNTIAYSPTAQAALKGADALLVVTDWKEFATVQPATFVSSLKDKLVFDGRNMFAPGEMQKAGLTYVSIGRGAVKPRAARARK